MGNYQDVKDAVQFAAEWWVKRKWTFLNEANEEFMEFVDPAVCYQDCLTEGDVVYLNMCFTEWVLFERPLRRGRTPLQMLADEPPSDAPAGAADVLRQIDETQLFSRFAIKDKDRETGMVVLVDVRTDRRYDVYDPHICEVEHWVDGSIGVRIACVDGAWQAVGQVYLYDRSTPSAYQSDGPGEMHPEDYLRKPEAEFAGFYMRLVRDVIGVEGRYHESMRAKEVAA